MNPTRNAITGWLSIPSTAAARTSPISVLIRGKTSGSRAAKALPCILPRFAPTSHKSKPACDFQVSEEKPKTRRHAKVRTPDTVGSHILPEPLIRNARIWVKIGRTIHCMPIEFSQEFIFGRQMVGNSCTYKLETLRLEAERIQSESRTGHTRSRLVRTRAPARAPARGSQPGHFEFGTRKWVV